MLANVANAKYQRFLPFLLRLAFFLVSAMGFPAECCTFLFKEITCSAFYQHRTPNGFVFFSVFSVPSCKWDCFHCWMVYKEKLTVHSVSWTHEGFSSWYFSECRSCSVVLFPRYTRKYSPAVHTNWLSFWSGVHFGLLVLVLWQVNGGGCHSKEKWTASVISDI